MATGSGKTFTAVTDSYRLIKFGKVKRILFLVDRNNLGRQTQQRVPAVRQPVQQPQVHRGIHGPAPPPQHDRPGRQGLHHHHPAALLDPQRRGRVPRRERRRRPVRDCPVALQGAAAGGLQSAAADRDVRCHHRRRVPPLDLQRLAAGAGILRRLHHRADGHAHGPNHRLLQRQPGAGLQPRAGGGGRRERRLRRLPHRNEDHQGWCQARQGAGAFRATSRPADPQEEAQGTRQRPDLRRPATSTATSWRWTRSAW